MKKKAVVVIAYARNELSEIEIISLNQVKSILGSYDIVLVTPMDLVLPSEYNCFIQKRVSNSFFGSVAAHNRLLYSTEFYNLFSDYEYMLLYHLDAFVFRDELDYWCEKNYDYIAAPIPCGFFDEMGAWIGNGGFSLRKIDTFIRILNNQQKIINEHPLSYVFRKAEDSFWAYCGRWLEGFNVPDVETAQKFCAQYCINGKLFDDIPPFGTHYYHILNYDVWYPIIKKYGHTMPESKLKQADDFGGIGGDKSKYWWKFYTMYTRLNKEKYGSQLIESRYSVWGGGIKGKECIRLLQSLKSSPVHVYDKNDSVLQGFDDFVDIIIDSPESPSFKNDNSILIVCINNIDDKIKSFLQDNRRKWITYESFIDKLWDKYIMLY